MIFPKKAKNLNDEWVWVVNIDNYTQSVEVIINLDSKIVSDNVYDFQVLKQMQIEIQIQMQTQIQIQIQIKIQI